MGESIKRNITSGQILVEFQPAHKMYYGTLTKVYKWDNHNNQRVVYEAYIHYDDSKGNQHFLHAVGNYSTERLGRTAIRTWAKFQNWK